MRYLLIFIAGVFLASCENLIIKDLELDETGFEKQIVIQSFLEANADSISALISENESVLARVNDIKFLPNIDARLMYDGSEVAKLEQGADGLYRHYFSEPVVNRGEYTLEINDGPYGDASASTMLPEDVGVTNTKVEFEVGTDPLDMWEVHEISFTINDAPGKDYYSLKINGVAEDIDTFIISPGDTIFEERLTYIYPASTQLDPSISTSGYDGDIVINDESFDGQTKEIKIRFQLNYWSTNIDYDQYKGRMSFDFSTHSLESFDYMVSVNAYDDAQDFALFSEPVSVFTNIENGLGVFGGRSVKTYVVD